MLFNFIAPFLFFLFSQSNSPSKEPVVNLLISHEISLENRYENKFVSDIFKDNILLNMAYIRGNVKKESDIVWSVIQKPFEYKFTLLPSKTFAFHDDVLEKYKNSVSVTSNAHFNFQEGFKTDGYLAGDGVCHLASLIYWVAKDAELDAYAPTNHNFRVIPEISKEYGVSIYSFPGSTASNAMQNLYITNNKENPVEFVFDYDGKNLKVSIYEITKAENSEFLSTPLLN